jgi:VWFA-related protein
VAVLVTALGIVLTLAFQQSQPAERFKSSIDLVQVDVSAVDANGRPIRDLGAEDFELKVDGRPRRIVSAQFVTVPSAIEMPAAAPPSQYSSNADAAGGRLIMIVVDRMSIATGRGKAAIEAASRFVDRLNGADRVALASIPRGPHVSFTADHALVRRLLQQIDGTAVASFGTRNIGIADALAFERRDQLVMDAVLERECGNVTDGGRGGGASDVLICRNEVRSEAGLVAADARQRARESTQGLRAVIAGFPPSQTPKILVYISEGLVIDHESAQLSWLDAAAAAANVTVYPLLLETSQFDASQRRPQAEHTAGRTALERGLATIAQATRGEVFRVVSNSDFAFERLASELSGYYLLGFEPDAGDRNGKPHGIDVAVRRRGVTVRARRQFTIGAASPRTPESEIVATLRDPLPAAEIPIKLTTYAVGDARPGKVRLLIAAEIDRSINPGGQLSIGYVVVDFDGKLAVSRMDTSFAATAPRQGGRDRYVSEAVVDEGRYTVKLVAIDDGRRRGSVERVAHAHLNQTGPIQATDLIVADDLGGGAEAAAMATVSGDITGDALHAYLELFADAEETLQLASVSLEIARAETSPALERASLLLRRAPDTPLGRTAGGRVDLARLPPGDYVARAVIAVDATTVGQVTRPFRMARAPATTPGAR